MITQSTNGAGAGLAPTIAGPDTRRRELVELRTPDHVITGSITLPAGYRSRLSDLLNDPERRFLSLCDVVIEETDGGGERRLEFMAVARDHVRWAVPLGVI